MEHQEVLALFKETEALRTGHFELRSGLHSDQFFQCALLLQHPLKTARLCEALIRQAGDVQPDVVIAPALGGITVGYEIGRQYGVRSVFAEKSEGKLVLRRGFDIREGERVVVAEDVITRGGRVQEVLDIVESRGGQVVGILVLVNRSGGKARFPYPLFSLLAMEPVTWSPEDCPLCRTGMPLEHPGS